MGRILFIFVMLACGRISAGQTLNLVSPDGSHSVCVRHISGNGTQEMVYSVQFEGRDVILSSAMGITVDNRVWEHALGREYAHRGRWPGSLRYMGKTGISRDTVWNNSFGERSAVKDRYNGMILHYGTEDGSGYRLDIEIRAYDEGIAFRYVLPMHPDAIYHRIKADNTGFTFPAGSQAWCTSWAQGPYELRPLEGWEEDMERPLTVRISEDLYAAVGEAGVIDFPRGKLRLDESGENTVVMSLNDDGTDIVTPYCMPWRVIMAADRLGDLVENNDIFLNLNEASAIADETWIRPGKIMRETKLTTENAFAVIDFCSRHSIDYILFDWLWYGPAFDFSSDATEVVAPIDMEAVIRYGKRKGVGVWLYVNQHALQRQGEEVFRTFEEWGVAGVKFGFVQFCNQHWASWLHHMVRLAAEHHLMVNIHDEYRPTGYSRTYPNLLTQEGIRGNEEFPPARHNTVLPFTRMLCGAGDYTVCYFDGRLKNTHAHQLALPVIFFSPLQTLYWYDSPSVVQEVPELAFFDDIPVVWDDTKVLDDSVGEHVAIARRSGDDWYVGIIAADNACTVCINTDFLDDGKYVLETYTDDESAETLTGVRCGAYIIDAGDKLDFRLAPCGGAALKLYPAGKSDLARYRRLGSHEEL